MRIALESPDQPDILDLIAALDVYQTALYPPESNHLLDLAALMQPNVLFAVVRDAAGMAQGCGAVVLLPDFGELKRMFVRPPFRRRGAAWALLAFLEDEALKAGCKLLRLETGIKQPEALGLYARAGYARCGPYAGYRDDPLSVFMQKRLER